VEGSGFSVFVDPINENDIVITVDFHSNFGTVFEGKLSCWTLHIDSTTSDTHSDASKDFNRFFTYT
jgi:hypothetical protein